MCGIWMWTVSIAMFISFYSPEQGIILCLCLSPQTCRVAHLPSSANGCLSVFQPCDGLYPSLPQCQSKLAPAPCEPPASMNSIDNGCEFCHNRRDGRMLERCYWITLRPTVSHWYGRLPVPTNFSKSETLSLATSHAACLIDQCFPSCWSAGIWSGKKPLVSMYPLKDACIPTHTHASTKLFQLVLILNALRPK